MTAVMPELSAVDAELSYRQCSWCGSAMERTRLLCSVCGSTEMAERISAGLGSVRRVLRVIRLPHAAEPIRQICSVHLDEGFTVLATVRHDRPLRVPEGSRVRLEAITGAHPALEFTPC